MSFNKSITFIQDIPLSRWAFTGKAILLSIGVYSETKCRLLQDKSLCYPTPPKRYLLEYVTNLIFDSSRIYRHLMFPLHPSIQEHQPPALCSSRTTYSHICHLKLLQLGWSTHSLCIFRRPVALTTQRVSLNYNQFRVRTFARALCVTNILLH